MNPYFRLLPLLFITTLIVSACNRDCSNFSVSGRLVDAITKQPIQNTKFYIHYTYRPKVKSAIQEQKTELKTGWNGEFSYTGISQCIITYDLEEFDGTQILTTSKTGDLGDIEVNP
ncbi:MAG: hypothetical protein R2831_11875 [Chitinophagaceae bacterium]